MTDNPLKKQVGGAHYKKYPIQPIEYAHKNGLGPCEANIVKYATRWKDKGGVEDLRKIIHYAELLISLVENKEDNAKEPKEISAISDVHFRPWPWDKHYDNGGTYNLRWKPELTRLWGK